MSAKVHPEAITAPGAEHRAHKRADSAMLDMNHVLQWNVAEATVGKGDKQKTILADIVGRTQSGELTAIMGPSGAGKTTLIECISLRNRNFNGAMQFNGKPTDGDYFTSSALVHQRELLFGFMTVREHLLFHAITRMSKNFTLKQIESRIAEVLVELQLEKCEFTMIGGTDPVFVKKGLSGGERKRLAIATELLLTPTVIFLDEPTSGLDSVMAEALIMTLSDLTARGRIVIASIHSPSSEMIKLFTHTVLLTCKGRLAFHGRITDALTHFASLGYKLPEAYNPSDFFLQLLSFRPHVKDDNDKKRIEDLVTSFKASSFYDKKPLEPDQKHRDFHFVQGLKVSSWALFKLNIWRGVLQTQRDVVSISLWGVVWVLLGVLFGVLYFQQASENWRNIIGLLFSVVVTMLITSSVSEMMRFPLEWAVVVREYFSGANSMGPYLTAKVFYDAPYIYGPLLFGTLLYWMAGFDPVFVEYLKFLGVIIMFNQCTNSLALLVSSFSTNPFVALTLLPGFITPMIMFSGILYERDTVPWYLSWIEKVSIVNYGFSSLISLQIHILPKPMQAIVLGFAGIRVEDLVNNLIMLAVLSVAFYTLTYVNLTIKLRFTSAA